MWKMDRANTGWRQGLAGCLGAWYVPIGERLSVVWDIDDRTALRVRKEGESSGEELLRVVSGRPALYASQILPGSS